MSVSTTPHVNFRGQAREALAFYQSVFGGETSIATYADIHAVEDGGQADHVAFGRVDAPNGFTIMAYDVQPSKDYDPGTNPFYITLHGTDGNEIQRLWDALATTASKILIPLAPAAFAPSTACSPTATTSPGSSAPRPPRPPTDHHVGGAETGPPTPGPHPPGTPASRIPTRTRRQGWSAADTQTRHQQGAEMVDGG